MAGLLRKSMEYLGLVDTDEDELYDDEPEDRRPRQAREVVRSVPDHGPVPEQLRGTDNGLAPEATDVRRLSVEEEGSVTVRTADPSPRITALHPRAYNDARMIGEHFRDGVPVIMNLTEMDDAGAKRLVDFAAGLIFGLRGNIEKITNKVFLLSPSNVTVSAEDKARIAEGGFFNQS